MTSLHHWRNATTRSFDIFLALIVLVPMIIICLPALLMIRIENPGNPLFMQTRVGRNQKPFTLFKLRTMSMDTEERGSHEISTAQITKVGKFLREKKIDELPQIINVLIGDMSFVGPRPCLPNQTELVSERSSRGVFKVRPGITGRAQLAGIDMSNPKQLAEVDAQYILERSFWSDLSIIYQTARGRGQGDMVKD